MELSGLRISWATPAASEPMEFKWRVLVTSFSIWRIAVTSRISRIRPAGNPLSIRPAATVSQICSWPSAEINWISRSRKPPLAGSSASIFLSGSGKTVKASLLKASLQATSNTACAFSLQVTILHWWSSAIRPMGIFFTSASENILMRERDVRVRR